MKALILNSGVGSRLGSLTNEHPKCMTELTEGDTILSRQLRQLERVGIREVVITTGPMEDKIIEHVTGLGLEMHVEYVNNPEYRSTNYIYSMQLAADRLDSDLILMHGDLVFSDAVLRAAVDSPESCMTVSSTLPLPEKDFKAVIQGGAVRKVGVEFFDEVLAAQPLYHLKKQDWFIWRDAISRMCAEGQVKCYAENALNGCTDRCHIVPLDVQDMLCGEIDTPEDLEKMLVALRAMSA